MSKIEIVLLPEHEEQLELLVTRARRLYTQPEWASPAQDARNLRRQQLLLRHRPPLDETPETFEQFFEQMCAKVKGERVQFVMDMVHGAYARYISNRYTIFLREFKYAPAQFVQVVEELLDPAKRRDYCELARHARDRHIEFEGLSMEEIDLRIRGKREAAATERPK